MHADVLNVGNTTEFYTPKVHLVCGGFAIPARVSEEKRERTIQESGEKKAEQWLEKARCPC